MHKASAWSCDACLRQTRTCISFSVSCQMSMSVKCTGWTKEGSCVSTSVWMSPARTTALAPVATSCSQTGGAVRVSDKREQRTKAHSEGPGRVCSSREEYLWFRETREPLAAELLVSAEVSVRPLSFAPLKLTMLASGMNDLTIPSRKDL